MVKAFIIGFAVVAVLGGALLIFRGTAGWNNVPEHAPEIPPDAKSGAVERASMKGEMEAPDAGTDEGVEEAGGEAADTPQSLLADYLMTGDKAGLDRASQLFPGNRLIMLQRALVADRPDSIDLERLEAKDPNNALPNLLRACLYAEHGDLTRFKEELEVVMNKDKLVTGHRERQAAILDAIIAKDVSDLDPDIYTGFDEGVFDHFGNAATALLRNPDLFGDDYDTAGYSVALARKLRSMVGSSLIYDVAAGQMEIDILRRLNPNDEIGAEGQTIGQRLTELEKRVQSGSHTVEKYIQPLMSSDGDPVLRLQFFARVRSDGERRAVDWLANQMDGR